VTHHTHDLTDRLARAQKAAAEAGMDALVISPGADLRYLTGYAALAMERLTCLVVPGDGAPRLVVPRLERPAAERTPAAGAGVDIVDHADGTRPSALAALTKGGLAAVARSLAIEYASRGIRVNAVSLGVIKTPTYGAESYEGIAALHPIGRVGEISDVVDGILYLEQATFVTGEILHIDGRQAAGH